MKKILFFLFLLIVFPISINAINTKSLYAMDIDSKREFYNLNGQEKRLIASTTKVMTAIVALENSNTTDLVKVNDEVLKMYGSNIYIEKNENILMIDLLYGLLLRSGNDAAIAIANHLGKEQNFIKLMNEKSKLLKLEKTIFNNPTGLDDDTKNYSTMKDLSYIYSYAYQNKTFKEIIKTNHYQTKSDLKSYDWYNRCKLINMYEKITGCKTGYTPDAKRVLVSSASNNDLNIVISSVDNTYDYEDHMILYDEIFNKYKNIKILNKDTFNYQHKDDNLYIKKDYFYPLTSEEQNSINYEISLKEKNIKIYLNNKLIHEEKIYQLENKQSFFDLIKSFFSKIID